MNQIVVALRAGGIKKKNRPGYEVEKDPWYEVVARAKEAEFGLQFCTLSTTIRKKRCVDFQRFKTR